MSHPIVELPIDRIDAAAAFCKERGCEVDVKKVRYTMSLLAGDVDAIAGVAVAHEIGEGRIDLYVTFDEKLGDLVLARRLADKALYKIHAHGVHRCRIAPVGPADVREFWQQVNWLDHAFAETQSAES